MRSNVGGGLERTVLALMLGLTMVGDDENIWF